MGYLDNVGLQYLWTKLKYKFAPKVHAHTKDQVGLSNVDNTADKDKSVKYATNAESANKAIKAASADTATVATTAENATTASCAAPASALAASADFGTSLVSSQPDFTRFHSPAQRN